MSCIYYHSCDRSERSYEQHFSIGSFPQNMLQQRFITDSCGLRAVLVDAKELGCFGHSMERGLQCKIICQNLSFHFSCVFSWYFDRSQTARVQSKELILKKRLQQLHHGRFPIFVFHLLKRPELRPTSNRNRCTKVYYKPSNQLG